MTELGARVPVDLINEILHAAVNVAPAGMIQPRADFAEVLKALRHKHGSSDDFAAAEEFVNSMLRRQNNTDPLKYDGSGQAIDWAHLARNASLKEIDRYLGSFDSYRRTRAMTWLMMSSGPERCIKIFLGWGNVCDAPWPDRSHIADALRRSLTEVRLDALLEPEDASFYAALPGLVPIWRGCERGLSWTTSRVVAEEFAQGKRCRNEHQRSPAPRSEIMRTAYVAHKEANNRPSTMRSGLGPMPGTKFATSNATCVTWAKIVDWRAVLARAAGPREPRA